MLRNRLGSQDRPSLPCRQTFVTVSPDLWADLVHNRTSVGHLPHYLRFDIYASMASPDFIDQDEEMSRVSGLSLLPKISDKPVLNRFRSAI